MEKSVAKRISVALFTVFTAYFCLLSPIKYFAEKQKRKMIRTTAIKPADSVFAAENEAAFQVQVYLEKSPERKTKPFSGAQRAHRSIAERFALQPCSNIEITA